MARMGKSRPGKAVAKTDDGKATKKHKPAKKNVLAPSVATPPAAASAAAAAADKKVNPKLLESIERRKKAQANGKGVTFARPGRRGRRPKGMVEYTPEHQEEDTFVMENEYEGIEYDTGISVKHAGEERGFNLDVDFDEELNFDW